MVNFFLGLMIGILLTLLIIVVGIFTNTNIDQEVPWYPSPNNYVLEILDDSTSKERMSMIIVMDYQGNPIFSTRMDTTQVIDYQLYKDNE